MNLRFVPVCVVALCFPVAAGAKPKPLKVTRDNFVSLNWTLTRTERAGEWDGKPLFRTTTESYIVQNNTLIWQEPTSPEFGGYGAGGGGFGQFQSQPYSPPPTKPLSSNQWTELLKRCNDLDWSALSSQALPRIAPGTDYQTLTLTISDANNADQGFTIWNPGAPVGMFKAYLGKLIKGKFPQASPPLDATPPALATPK